jgi:hypothetical protein
MVAAYSDFWIVVPQVKDLLQPIFWKESIRNNRIRI